MAKPNVEARRKLALKTERLLRQGMAFHQSGALSYAQETYEQILSMQPRHAEALHLLGVIAGQQKDFKKSTELISRAVAENPNDGGAHYNLAKAYRELGLHSDAAACFNRAVALMPDSAEAHNNLGNTLLDLGRFEDALQCFDRAIGLKPDYAYAHYNRGNALQRLSRLEDALAAFDRSIAIDPAYAEACNNRGNVLKELGQPQAGVEAFNRAIALRPNFADAYYNRGLAFEELSQLEAAIADYRHAVLTTPDYADAYVNLGLALLAGGFFEEGWRHYEWRWEASECESSRLVSSRPLWSGARSERRLFLWAEQGIGDQVLFGSMLRDIESFPQKKIVLLHDKLAPLFRRSFPTIDFVTSGTPVSESDFDEHLPLGSLGALFRPTAACFPDTAAAYLKPDPERSMQLRAALVKPGRRVCGLSWFSKNKKRGVAKSLALAELVPILSLPAFEFVNLQYGNTAAETAALKSECGIEITSVPEVDNYNDIDGLAALIGACDLVVTVSNTTAHLAGALGKDTLLLLPQGTAKLWYWRSRDGVSLYYPSIRLFQQREPGDWAGVIREAKEYLETRG